MWLESLVQDVRYAIRGYLKAPAFALTIVATLALGIGASTAIFSLVHGILLEPLPLDDPDRLIFINEISPTGNGMSVSWPTYLDWVERARMVAAIADSRSEDVTLTGVERPQRVKARRATTSFFGVVGARPVLGTTFSAGADRPNAAGEVVLSDGFWRAQTGADPRVLGRTLVLDAVPYTVVGVLSPGFEYIEPYDAFISMGPVSGTAQLIERGNHSGFYAVARLKPGVDIESADREFKTIAATIEREHPKTNAGISTRVERLADRVVSTIRPTLLALFGAVGFLLLIACVNVANLLIARGAARQHEMAVRAAVGGSRSRLTAQLLTESTTIAVVGGALGIVIAIALLRLLIAVAPDGTPRLTSVHLDTTALLFALAAAATCGIVFGLFPAALAWRLDRQGSVLRLRSSGAAAGTHRLRRALVIVETALAIVLLTGAGLTIRTVSALTRVDTGFQMDHLLTMRIELAGEEWTAARRLNLARDLTARVRALPGVSNGALAHSLPIDGSQWGSVFVAADKPVAVRAQTPVAAISPVGDGYFATLRMRVLRGRVFDERDSETSPLVVVVNEALAKRIWPGEDPVGKRLKQGWIDSPTPWRDVVGVVGDVKFEGITEDTPMQVYIPMPQNPVRSVAIVVRTPADPVTVSHAVENVVHDLNHDLPVYSVRTMNQVLDASIARQRMAVTVFATFAMVALVLAAVGLYGVVAHGVTERIPEIGVRIALGAERRDVLLLIIRQGLSMALVGTAVGVAAAAGLSRAIANLLFGVTPTDPATFAVVVAALLGVAAMACALPAWRAARLDPTLALRSE